MLKGTTTFFSLEKQYETLKGKILDYMNDKLSPEGYQSLLTELTLTQLRLNARKYPTILWWVVYASCLKNPRLLIDIWNKHNHQLTHRDFCASQGTNGSPLWYLAAIAGFQPRFIAKYFSRFGPSIKIDSLTEVFKVNDEYQVSIFGLLAYAAISSPQIFEGIWPNIKDDISDIILNRKETIAGVVTTPIRSLIDATFRASTRSINTAEKLNVGIVHFCFEQYGDLRPGLPSGYRLPGAIIRKETDDTVRAFDLAVLQHHKDLFFDELARIKNDPSYSYNNIILLGRAALNAGFLNSGYYLAQHFREKNRLEYVHEALNVLPKGSIYQQYGLNKCIDWYLSKFATESNTDTRFKYLTKALGASLKIASTPLRIRSLNRVAHLYIHGKELPDRENSSLIYDFLNSANEQTSVKAVLLALANHKSVLNGGIKAEIVQEANAFSAIDNIMNQEEEQQALQPLPKPRIPRMGEAEEYKLDPTPPLFNLDMIDHNRYGISMQENASAPTTKTEFVEFEQLSTLMSTDEVMLLINPAIHYVKLPRASEKPAESTATLTQPCFALPLAPELADIDPLRKYRPS